MTWPFKYPICELQRACQATFTLFFNNLPKLAEVIKIKYQCCKHTYLSTIPYDWIIMLGNLTLLLHAYNIYKTTGQSMLYMSQNHSVKSDLGYSYTSKLKDLQQKLTNIWVLMLWECLGVIMTLIIYTKLRIF